MFAELTSKNRLTLLNAVVADFQSSEYFDVTNESGRIVLALGMSEADAAEAVKWARRAR